jgi:uncharacterized protein
MEFTNEFIVPTRPDAAWALLTDIPRIAPCLPGATITSFGDGRYEGAVTVKVGPIKVGYRGTASFTELDTSNRRMMLDARGTESNGKGSANAIITVDLLDEGSGKTRVLVSTHLQVTGKVAQFGRSAMADIGARLVGQFAANLETMLSGSDEEPRAFKGDVQPANRADSELDALALARPILKRGAVVAGAFLLGALTMRLITRR